MKIALAAKLPNWSKVPLRALRDHVDKILFYGERRFCPVCRKSSPRFQSSGRVPRKDAKCIHCGALERHRLLWLYMSRRTNLFEGKSRKMLHVAPEPCFEPFLRQHLGDNYITADLFDSRAMVKMDITNINYPDESFDVIYCSHVLEHVQDDRKAMREFYRILKNDGWAILLVPINVEETFEDPSITEAEERLRIFGQRNHVRNYGPDYVDRLCDAGFCVKIPKVNDFVQNDEIIQMGLTSASGEIYYCTKQSIGG
jgi:SAM-dependent methyltransferase